MSDTWNITGDEYVLSDGRMTSNSFVSTLPSSHPGTQGLHKWIPWATIFFRVRKQWSKERKIVIKLQTYQNSDSQLSSWKDGFFFFFFFGCTTELTWSACTATQSCLTLCDPMDCSLPHSTVHGIFQAIFQEWVVVHLLSYDQLFETPWTTVCQASLFFTLSWSLLKFMSVE